MAKRKTLFMETTEVEPGKTAAEIMGCLQGSGRVRRIANSYDTSGEIIALEFSIGIVGAVEWEYRLPVRVDPVFKILNGRRDGWNQSSKAAQDLAQAKRVAWRQLLRWIQAQLAMIDTGMVAPEEVFMPYRLDTARERTMFEHMVEREIKMLEAPAEGVQ
jgi:hypothetical protein